MDVVIGLLVLLEAFLEANLLMPSIWQFM